MPSWVPRRASRGSALILTLFFLLTLHLLSVAFITLIPTESNSATRHKQDVLAYYACDSGLQDTLAWMENRNGAGTLDADILALGLVATPDPDESVNLNRYYRRVSNAVTAPTHWGWEARIFPDPYTAGNPNIVASNPVRAYKLKLIASFEGTPRREMTAWINQSSFAQRAYMYSSSPSVLWFNLGTFKINGPFHTNDRMRLSIPSGYSWNTVGSPNDGTNHNNAPFQGRASFAVGSNDPNLGFVDGIQYNSYSASYLPYSPTTGDPVALTGVNAGMTRYDRLNSQGRSGFVQDSPVTVPTISTTLADSAWGGTPPGSPIAGVNVNPGASVTGSVSVGSTGVPVHELNNGFYLSGGTVTRMELSVDNGQDGNSSTDGDNNSILRFKQGATWRRVTTTYSDLSVNLPAGSVVNGVTVSGLMTVPAGYTIVQNNESTRNYTVCQGTGNGLFYLASGNINELGGASGSSLAAGGVNKGRRTIAVNQSTNAEIRLTDSLTRADTVPGNAPAANTFRDQLGLVGYAVRFATQKNGSNINRSVYTTTEPLYLYAAIFAGRNGDPNSASSTAGGGFGSMSYNNSGYGAGEFKMFGSLTEGVRQAKGTFNAATGTTSSGFGYSYNYDPNYDQVQPPFFPAETNFRVRTITERIIGG